MPAMDEHGCVEGCCWGRMIGDLSDNDKARCGRCQTHYMWDSLSKKWRMIPDDGFVPRCPDCEEPNKCQVMGCGAAAMLRAGILPKRFEGSVLGKVCDRLETLENAVLRRLP